METCRLSRAAAGHLPFASRARPCRATEEAGFTAARHARDGNGDDRTARENARPAQYRGTEPDRALCAERRQRRAAAGVARQDTRADRSCVSLRAPRNWRNAVDREEPAQYDRAVTCPARSHG